MNLAIFDIDGTLTETNAVDEICFVQAFADAHSITQINTNWMQYQYVTDSGIMFQVFRERFGRPPADGELRNYKSCLVNLLETHRSRDCSLFAEISGASRALTRLNQETEWVVALATGCWRVSAELKLKAAGIQAEHLPAAFAEDGLSRETILQTAMSRAQRSYSQSHFERIVSLGDALWDVQAASKLGIPFVGVGKGDRGLRLRQVGATHVLEGYSDYRKLIDCLRKAEVPNHNKCNMN
jgi:phosphoglycolate phosphatase-like HAD superfamily hydrolase